MYLILKRDLIHPYLDKFKTRILGRREYKSGLCRPKHVPNSLVMHLASMPLHCSPGAPIWITYFAPVTNELTQWKNTCVGERERTEAIKKHLFGRVRGWCSWFDWFVYTCGSVCTAVPTLSHRESGAKIFWFDIDAYYVAYFWEIWHWPHSGRQKMPKLFTCS